MAKNLLIPGSGGPVFQVTTADPASPLTTELLHVKSYLVRIVAGDLILPAEAAQMAPIIRQTLAVPDAGGEVLAGLLSPAGVATLQHVLEQPLLASLDPHTSRELLQIAGEANEDRQVTLLAQLVIERSAAPPANQQAPYQPGKVANLPGGVDTRTTLSQAGASIRVEPQTIGDRNPPPVSLNELQQLAQAGATDQLLQTIRELSLPQLDSLWDAKNSAAAQVLMALVQSDDPYYANYATGVLTDQGTDFLQQLRQMAGGSSELQSIVHAIVAGEAPPVAPSALPGAALEAPPAALPANVGSLIAQLASPDPQSYMPAMQELHELGESVIDDLMLAKADPATSERASQLLRWHFAGEAPWQPGSPQENSAGPALDTDRLVELLANPTTRMDTLGSLIQIGAPAKTALCNILLRPSL